MLLNQRAKIFASSSLKPLMLHMSTPKMGVTEKNARNLVPLADKSKRLEIIKFAFLRETIFFQREISINAFLACSSLGKS